MSRYQDEDDLYFWKLRVAALILAQDREMRLWRLEWFAIALAALLPILLATLATGIVRPVTSGFAVLSILTVTIAGSISEARRRQAILESMLTLMELLKAESSKEAARP